MQDNYDSTEAIRRWDMHARELTENFTEEGDKHRIVLLNPVLLQLLDNVEGKKILDAGCGEGYLSRLLAKQGASVTGVDFSEEMLAIAQERTKSALGIRYVHGNCEKMDFFETESFDIIVSNMVLQDLSDHKAALRSMYRILVDRGLLIFSISHPCFSTPNCGWVRDNQGKKLYWKVDRYFEEGAFEQTCPPNTSEYLLLFHRTLSTYLKALLNVGFELLDVVEPKPSEEMLSRYPEFVNDLRMSHFIVFKAIKAGHGNVVCCFGE